MEQTGCCEILQGNIVSSSMIRMQVNFTPSFCPKDLFDPLMPAGHSAAGIPGDPWFILHYKQGVSTIVSMEIAD
jgi:hypothetical protein